MILNVKTEVMYSKQSSFSTSWDIVYIRINSLNAALMIDSIK